MNWKLIIALSLVSIVIAFTGVYGVTTMQSEPLIWLAIFIVYAVIIARFAPGNYFLHGFLVSVLNGLWIGAIHVLNFHTYMRSNPGMKKMYDHMPHIASPKITMVLMAPVFGAALGLIAGLFAFIASRIIKKKVAGNG